MHVTKILHQLLASTIHKIRIKSLIPVITALIECKQLRLTQLGRSLVTSGQERAGIRRVDRLLSNTFYQKNSIELYKAMSAQVVANQHHQGQHHQGQGLPFAYRNKTYNLSNYEIIHASGFG